MMNSDSTQTCRSQNRIQDRFVCRLPCLLVLASQMLERFVFYGLIMNIVFLLTSSVFQWSPVNATTAVFLLIVMAYFVPFFAGALADSLIGKFWVIVIGYVLYLFVIFFPVILLDPKKFLRQVCTDKARSNITRSIIDECGAGYVIAALVLVGAGAGCIRSVMSPFGADQVGDESSDRLRNYFFVYYWTVNLGAGLSILGFSYIQQLYAWPSYLGLFCVAVLSQIVFIMGYWCYMKKRPEGSPLSEITKVIWQAGKRACIIRCCPNRVESDRVYRTNGQREEGPDVTSSVTQSSDLLEARISESEESMASSCFLDRAKTRHGGTYSHPVVDRVRIFVRVILIHVSLITFWVIYWQMQSTFLLQGIHMNVSPFYKLTENRTGHYFQVPVAWLGMFDVLAVIICIPVVEGIFSVMKNLGYASSPYSRMAIGLFFALMSMMSAGLVEFYRLEQFWGNGTDVPENAANQTIGWENSTYFASPMSIFWQIPQYTLLGIGEALITVASLEYTCRQSPPQYVSLLNGFLWLSACIGGLIGVGIINLCDGENRVFMTNATWGSINYRVCEHPGCWSRLAIYFFAMGGLHVVGIVVFFMITRFVVPPSQPTSSDENRRSDGLEVGAERQWHYDFNSSEPPFIG